MSYHQETQNELELKIWFVVIIAFAAFLVGYVTADDQRIDREMEAQSRHPVTIAAPVPNHRLQQLADDGERMTGFKAQVSK